MKKLLQTPSIFLWLFLNPGKLQILSLFLPFISHHVMVSKFLPLKSDDYLFLVTILFCLLKALCDCCMLLTVYFGIWVCATSLEVDFQSVEWTSMKHAMVRALHSTCLLSPMPEQTFFCLKCFQLACFRLVSLMLRMSSG